MCRQVVMKHAVEPARSYDASLLVLSTGWLALCTGLVVKHWELLTVFFSFLGCFALASGLNALSSFQVGKQSQRTIPRYHHSRIRQKVGIVAHSVALSYMSCHDHLSYLLLHFPLLNSVSSEFVALSLAAGYLAFDHWYTPLYCAPKSLRDVSHDAVSLSSLAIILSIVADDVLKQYRTLAASWFVYQILRLSSGTTLNTAVTPLTTGAAVKILPSKKDLWFVQGQAYDLRPFIDRHPGGREALLLGQGRDDCTALVLSYHPFSLDQVQAVLSKYRVAKQHDDKTLSLTSFDAFYTVLRQRVEKALREQGFDPSRDRAANWLRVGYYFVVFSGVLLSGYFHVKGNLLGSFLFAVAGWLIGSLGHDSGHFAATRHAWLNDIGVWGMSLLCNPIMWQHQHTYAHHSFTNDFEADPDLHHFHTLLRVHRRFQHARIYRNQRYLPFVFLAYALVVFGECVWIPLGMLREGTLYGIVEWTDRKRPLRAFGMMAHLATYAAIILVAPFLTTRSWYYGLACVVVHVTTAGLLFGFFSQINHLNETSVEIKSSQARHRHPKTENSWAAVQVETSNNFCSHSIFWYYLSNGLNLQIEHHLFPGLNHCNLWRIAPVVEATCAEYGVSYKSWDTWGQLWCATRSWLDKLAKEESSPEH